MLHRNAARPRRRFNARERYAVILDEKVCVIIAAKNAEQTIGRAVRSALAEPDVGEVLVV